MGEFRFVTQKARLIFMYLNSLGFRDQVMLKRKAKMEVVPEVSIFSLGLL